MTHLWIKLTRREKYYVSAGIALVITFIVFQFILSPFWEGKKNIKHSIQAKGETLNEIISLSSEYRTLKGGSINISKALASRPENFTLFSFLEKQAGRAGVKPNIKYMKPSTSTDSGPHKELSVEMKLENITLRQLVEYLYLVESPRYLIKIKRISIKQSKGSSQYLTALIHLITYK